MGHLRRWRSGRSSRCGTSDTGEWRRRRELVWRRERQLHMYVRIIFPFNQREKIKAARLALMGLCVPRIGRNLHTLRTNVPEMLVACSVVRCCCYFRHAVRRTANIVYYIIISARSHAHLHTEAHEGPAIRLLQYGVAGAGSRKLNLPPEAQARSFPSALRLQRSIPRASEITSTPLARGPRAYIHDCIYVLPAIPWRACRRCQPKHCCL